MKHFRFTAYILVCLILSTLVALPTFAHGGKTDGNGGHYDKSTGSYHYHHGYPAHQHTLGRCPYAYDDKTDHSPGDSKNSVNTETTTAETDTDEVTTKTSKNWFERNGSTPRTVQTTKEAETKGNFFTDWNVSFGQGVAKVVFILFILGVAIYISLWESVFLGAIIIHIVNKRRRWSLFKKEISDRAKKIIYVISFIICFIPTALLFYFLSTRM